jgi:ribonucleoside-diphosphate reductase beta chain
MLMLFEEQLSRKPDLYPWANDFIETMHNGFWTDKEFSFKSDIQDFRVNLEKKEQEIIKKTMSAIGQIEVAVKKFWANLGNNLPHPSITDLGYVMANVEVIHNNAYERLLGELGLNHVFEENLKLDIIKNRVNYLKKYTNRVYTDQKKQYIYALILFTLFVENVSLFSQFYIVSWFNRFKNVLKDTDQQIKYTKSEEETHSMVGIKITNVLREEYPELFDEELEKKVLDEAQEAFKAESNIIDWIIGDYSDTSISAAHLKEFIKNRINESLKDIGFSQPFEIDNNLLEETFWFDEQLHGNNHADFFHSRPTEYIKSNQCFDHEELFA